MFVTLVHVHVRPEHIDAFLDATRANHEGATREAGNVRWVRTQVVLPADEDPRWVLQMYQRPLVKSGRLYVAQPGVRTVECLAAAGAPMRAGEVNKVLGREETAGSVNAVRTALERLAKASRVQRVGRGLYQTAG